MGVPEEDLGVIELNESPRTAVVTVVVLAVLPTLIRRQRPGVSLVLAMAMLYVVMATALGFACGAARQRTGATWMAVGVHTGFHIGVRLFATREIDYGVQLVVEAVTLSLTTLAILAPFRRHK